MILCIGEIVWDLFPTGKVLGGAPLNVAYQLTGLGQEAHIISRIGNDPNGLMAAKKIQDLGLSTEMIQTDAIEPTGTVTICIDSNNEPNFQIDSPAAWDEINPPSPQYTHQPFQLVIGTLAQRSEKSRATIHALIKQADLVYYDVNLRPPFTPKAHVISSLEGADVSKMNEEELSFIHSWSSPSNTNLESMAEDVRKQYKLEVLAVTLGKKGALIATTKGIFHHPGFEVELGDTVGAGDAFFAALIDGITRRLPWPTCLKQANRRGAYVASQTGATPDMTNINQLIPL